MVTIEYNVSLSTLPKINKSDRIYYVYMCSFYLVACGNVMMNVDMDVLTI